MTEFISVEKFYKNMMVDIEKKINEPDKDIIQKITPLFNQIKHKNNQKKQLKHFIERSEKILKNEKIPAHISLSIESGKNKLIKELKDCTEILEKIEKKDYAKVVLLANMFILDKSTNVKIEEFSNVDVTKELPHLFVDLEYWIKFQQWDYVDQCAKKFNLEENIVSAFQLPSPLEIYYNYCRIS
jgi:hypothetical protein